MTPKFTRYKNGNLDGCDDWLLPSPYPGVNWCNNCYYRGHCSVYIRWLVQTLELQKEAA